MAFETTYSKMDQVKICGVQPLKNLKWYGLLKQTHLYYPKLQIKLNNPVIPLLMSNCSFLSYLDSLKYWNQWQNDFFMQIYNRGSMSHIIPDPWNNGRTIHTTQWMFFTFFKLCKWYQIAQSISYLRRCLWEAAIQECSQKIIVLRSSHWDVL